MSNPIQTEIKKRMDDVRAGLREWLKASTDAGTPIVDQNQAEPAPSVWPYVSFGFLGSLTKLGRSDSFVWVNEKQAFILRMHRQATISIHCHGKPYQNTLGSLVRATDVLTGVQSHIDEPVAYAALQKRDIAILGDNGVLDLTNKENGLWVPRANLDLFIGLSISVVVYPGYIEHAEISGKLDANFDGDYERVFGPITYPPQEV